jgi:hypothetical protein
MTMRVLVWTSLLLLLTIVGSGAALVRMIGMPIGPELFAAILVLATTVGVMGAALVIEPEARTNDTDVIV